MSNQYQLAVILFADLVGYTRLMQEEEHEALSTLKRFKEITERCTEENKGRIIQYFGDGCLVTFSSCIRAVTCAEQMQLHLRQDPVVQVRIGLHLGDILYDGHNAYGNGVNIASRIESLACPGSVFMSKSVRDQVVNKTGIEAKSLGLQKFKNVRDPIEVYALIKEGLVTPESSKSSRFSSFGKFMLTNLIWIVLIVVGFVTLVYAILGKEQPGWNPQSTFSITPLSVSSWFEGWGSWSPDGDMYTYMSLKSGNGDLYIRNRSGGNSIQITNTPYDEYNARWSPNGNQIAYISIRKGQCNIYSIPSTGGTEKLLVPTNIPGIEQNITTFFALGAAPWSSDGEQLLYSSMDEDRTISVWSLNVNTGEKIQRTFPPGGSQDLMASWSHDDQKVLFTRNQRIYLRELKSDNSHAILTEQHQASMPIFDRSDSKIIFALSKPGNQNIWDYDLERKVLRQITNFNKRAWGALLIPTGGLSVDEFSHQIDLIELNLIDKSTKQLSFYRGDNSYSRYSPDGKHIIYQSDRSGNLEVWLHALNQNSEELNLTKNPSTDFKPDWAPDGSRIAFFSNREGPYQVWSMNPSGLELQQESQVDIELGTSLIKTVHQLKWSPDGSKIGYLALGPQGPSLWIIDRKKGTCNIAISGVNSFVWYRSSDFIIYHRQDPNVPSQSQLVAVHLKTGSEKILLDDIPLTELFIGSKGLWLGYTSATGHFSYALHRIALDSIADDEGFPKIVGSPEELANGTGRWHVHNGCFSPDGQSVIFSRDADKMDMYTIDDYQ